MATQSVTEIILSPVQQQAVEWFAHGLSRGHVFELGCDAGIGRTTVLRHLQNRHGGILLNARQWVEKVLEGHPMALEDAFYRGVIEALEHNDLVLVDDLHLLVAATSHCHFNPRSSYMPTPIGVLAAFAQENGKKLIVGTDGNAPDSYQNRRYYCGMRGFSAADYRQICAHWMGDASTSINFEKVHRFAPKLNGHQLRTASIWLRDVDAVDSDKFVEYLRSQRLASNVNLDEVVEVDLSAD